MESQTATEMHFSNSEDQTALRNLARQILGDQVTQKSLEHFETSGEWFHRAAWDELARAQLTGVALPESYGGSGLGLAEFLVLLEEAGRAVAPVPLLPSLLSALAVAEFGSKAHKTSLLPGAASGQKILSVALNEPDAFDPLRPRVTATAEADGGWRLDGVKTLVPVAGAADAILVPAAVAGKRNAVIVLLIDPKANGVTVEKQIATNYEPFGLVTFNGATVGKDGVLGTVRKGPEILRWIADRYSLGLCAGTLGVAERALEMTAEYARMREQFGRPIAFFQAVAQRAAEAFIAIETMRLSHWQAAWRLSNGVAAEIELPLAKYLASDGGHAVTAAAQHIHGGMGFDRDHPLHRYFLTARLNELQLGSAAVQLGGIGKRLAGDIELGEAF